MEPAEYVKVEAEPKVREKEEKESKSDTIIAPDMAITTMIATDPWMLFLYALKAPASCNCKGN